MIGQPDTIGRSRGDEVALPEPGKNDRMPLQLTMCSRCSRNRPEFLRTVAQLAATYRDRLMVVEVECMAACDEGPAVMLDYDYHSHVTPADLQSLVARLITR